MEGNGIFNIDKSIEDIKHIMVNKKTTFDIRIKIKT